MRAKASLCRCGVQRHLGQVNAAGRPYAAPSIKQMVEAESPGSTTRVRFNHESKTSRRCCAAVRRRHERGYGTDSLGLQSPFLLTPVSETPLPAALPLFATGLGALGLLGWRRKRKAAAIAA